MRRAYKGKSDGLVRSSEGEQGFWPSYADMMSALALILFFLMLLSYIQNLITGNDLRNTQDVLDETRSKLNATTIELDETEKTLSLTLSQVEKAESDLAKITIDLDETRLTLADTEEELAGLDALIGEQRALIGEQEEYMKAASEELLKLRGQMQTIAVLRLSILEQIRESFVEITGDASKVSIGENGNIILSESILFDTGSSKIKNDAKGALDSLAEMFVAFLENSENAKYVDSIVIAGHTDSTGTDEENRVLSTDRANSVLGYLMSANSKKLGKYAEYFCASGYGETRPVATNDTKDGRAQNRRIEISVTLKDESIMEIVDSYLDLELPEKPETAQ
ncbi:MAG: OmpA family protein [Oscillospiraceae bacterium]|nr:OmpA family protein [Oscillospiraceae bacterium]